jgi:hypothetical protein
MSSKDEAKVGISKTSTFSITVSRMTGSAFISYFTIDYSSVLQTVPAVA